MLKAIYDISHWGTQYVVQEGKYRNVVLCNRIAMISLAMSLVLMVAAFTVYGVSYIYQYALPSNNGCRNRVLEQEVEETKRMRRDA